MGCLVRDPEEVVVVAAGSAWPFYRSVGGYVCQPERTFRRAGRMAFYSRRLVHGAAARIERVVPRVALTEAETARRALSLDPVERRIGEIMMAAMAEPGDLRDVEVVVLSPLHHPDTIEFEPLPHHGEHAWTMNQRYVRLSDLLAASTTVDLSGRGDEDDAAPMRAGEPSGELDG
jgi:hypothetical protein